MEATMQQAEQRMAALQAGNAIRLERSRLKRDLKAGRLLASDVLSDPPAFLDSMLLEEFLLAVPTIGPRRVGEWFRRFRWSPFKTVGMLVGVSRGELVVLLRGRGQ